MDERSEELVGLDYIIIKFELEKMQLEVESSVSKLTAKFILRQILTALEDEDDGTDMA
jgi:hypothetical protein